MSDSLPIHCPACGAGYLLPTHLLGEQGARVRCPGCQCSFAVSREGTPIPEPTEAFAPKAPASAEPRAIAADLLVALEAHSPGAMQQAAGEGRLFAAHGPALLEAYDEFRRRAGAQSGSEAFREEVLARYGVDLFAPRTAR